MALSQVQCLDDHHVNWRVNESKPEFFYSEDQRLAVETLINSGRDAFVDFIKTLGVRQFLSDQELDRIENYVELYRPGHEHHQRPDTPMTPGPGNMTPGPGNMTPGPGNMTPGAGDDTFSLQYWPDRSEFSVAELDLGWPESISYRGVTRVNVHTQPPSEGQTHIKEVVRKSIASAQKVIAVVMDVFTDVDIFRDLLDASYKRKIPVYIILDTASVPCFLSMCGQADMHRGHLKNLRVRSCGGVEFLTRSAQKVRGSLKEKFLLVDGDRAISGSYSFTWSSSRLDRNVITVITGQAVETFDLQFRDLYLLSRGVSLNKIPMADEPIPEPLPQAAPAPVSATVARKLINPKYALVAAGNHISPTSSDQNSTKQNSSSQLPTGLKLMKGRLKEVQQELPLHPGLANLERAYLIPYLPTWPEPDPPSDVIGFINIRDEKRAHQVHLQRSERFEVSQAIRFSSPLTTPAKTEEKRELSPTAKVGNDEKSKNTEATTPTEVKTVTPARNDQVDSKVETVVQKDKESSQDIPTEKTITENQSMDVANQEVESQIIAPPVPKRRTLQLVIDTNSTEKPAEAQVTLVKMDQEGKDLPEQKTPKEEVKMTRHRLQSQREERDSASNEEGSQDSTKVICDRGIAEDPSSNSTESEEEFYDAQAEQQKELVMNGVTSGSNQGNRLGDGLNVMARFSQSMLDLREPTQTEDSMALIRQSQQMRRQKFHSPHRHIGQLFESSRSPDRGRVIMANPGVHNHQGRAAAPVMGGHLYWQSQMLPPDPGKPNAQTRSGRSPQREPNYRKGQQSSDHPPASPTGLLGVSFSKLTNLKHLKARAGASQKKVPQMNRANQMK